MLVWTLKGFINVEIVLPGEWRYSLLICAYITQYFFVLLSDPFNFYQSNVIFLCCFFLQVFRNRLEFYAAAKVASSFPPPDLPEIAFAGIWICVLRCLFILYKENCSAMRHDSLLTILLLGRSNVGKSSLLNALTRQWGVVRTSDKPGHTRVGDQFIN